MSNSKARVIAAAGAGAQAKPRRGRRGAAAVLLTLFLSVLGASLGVNAGAVAPEQVPVAAQQEAEAHGSHTGDPCGKTAFWPNRDGTLIRATGYVGCGVTNGHAKWHNLEGKLQRYESWRTWTGKVKWGWRTKSHHRSPGRSITGTPELSVVPAAVCPRGRATWRLVVTHNVNGDLGPQSWSVPSRPKSFVC